MKKIIRNGYLLFAFLLCCLPAVAQYNATVTARVDASHITVGDQVHMFINVQYNAKQSTVQWATIPDSFNHLQIVEKGKIDTLKQGDIITCKQRLLITGFDSGMFYIPSFTFNEILPGTNNAKAFYTDSIPLSVQTVAVDTTKGFKGIKGIIQVKSTWKDYIGIILGGILFIVLAIFIVIYFIRNKKIKAPAFAPEIKETLQEKTLKQLDTLEQKQLWQNRQVKEYYIELTDIIRNYIELRFHTPALELTTDELLYSTSANKEMAIHKQLLANILYTADLAKFAKAEPMPHEHTTAMENARQFINATKPVIVTETTQTQS